MGADDARYGCSTQIYERMYNKITTDGYLVSFSQIYYLLPLMCICDLRLATCDLPLVSIFILTFDLHTYAQIKRNTCGMVCAGNFWSCSPPTPLLPQGWMAWIPLCSLTAERGVFLLLFFILSFVRSSLASFFFPSSSLSYFFAYFFPYIFLFVGPSHSFGCSTTCSVPSKDTHVAITKPSLSTQNM